VFYPDYDIACVVFYPDYDIASGCGCVVAKL
jgi:hypothetical protein